MNRPGRVRSYQLGEVHKPHKRDVDKQVDDKRRPEGIAPVSDISKVDTRQYGAYGLDVGFAKMQKYKRDHLDEYACLPQFLLQPEK